MSGARHAQLRDASPVYCLQEVLRRQGDISRFAERELSHQDIAMLNEEVRRQPITVSAGSVCRQEA